MLSDIEIAQSTKLLPVADIAAKLDISDDQIEYYGKYKAKIDYKSIDNSKKGKLVLVTAISPTPAGEGKTTTSIGLSDALCRLGKNSILALREPSLGPVFGIKGGAAGGGYAQVVPMEDINLHFTGDMHAIGAANNLLCAMIDNHIFHGNELNIDTRKITFKRCVDMNDRQLRNITDGLGGRVNGVPREDGFDITVASEVMATLCLSNDLDDLKNNLSNIIVGYTRDDKPVTAGDLKAQGAMCALLKDAIKPNLVQTLEHNPAFIHGGPFANIAHGCNSIIATKLALSLSEYTVTEAGFGADLGAEKFLDIKCQKANLSPDAVVIVATIRALKHHGGVKKENLSEKNIEALSKGVENLKRHLENMLSFGLPCVVAINRFPTDTEEEIAYLKQECKKLNVNVCLSEVFAKGSKGGVELAEEVIRLCENESSNFKPVYTKDMSVEEKLNAVAKKIYRANGVIFTPQSKKELLNIEKCGYSNLLVCVAKTQYSFSDDQTKLGAPDDFYITVKSLKISAGAGFVVALTGDIMTMPGLPKLPAAQNIDIDSNGKIVGLF